MILSFSSSSFKNIDYSFLFQYDKVISIRIQSCNQRPIYLKKRLFIRRWHSIPQRSKFLTFGRIWARYNFEKKSAEEQSRVPHNDGAVKSDGWINVLTGLGMRGRDKNVNAHFRMERIFEQAELDQLYRSDGVTRRIMDIVPAEMVRQGWEIEGDSNQEINC